MMSSKSLSRENKVYGFALFPSLGHVHMNFIQGHNGGAVGTIPSIQLQDHGFHPDFGFLFMWSFVCLHKFPLGSSVDELAMQNCMVSCDGLASKPGWILLPSMQFPQY